MRGIRSILMGVVMSCATAFGAARPMSVAELRTRAAANDPAAQLELAQRLEKGAPGLAADGKEAQKWLRAAADAGHPPALLALGRKLVASGEPANEGVEWFRKAAAKDNADALMELGKAYLAGRGVEKDEAKGIDVLKQAAERGSLDARYELGTAYMNGVGVAADPSAAANFYKMSAEKDHVPSLMALANMYKEGTGVSKDPRQTLQLSLKAAQLGNLDAMREAARMYQEGDGTPQNTERAVIWLRKLAEARDAAAHVELAALSPETYRKFARPITLRAGKPVEQTIGTAVSFDGRIKGEGRNGGWAVEIKNSSGTIDLPVETKNYKGNARPGQAVRVYGDVTSDLHVRALIVDLPQPKFEWKYKLRSAGAAAGQNQTYVVDGAVKNTGSQPLKNIKVEVRMYQTSSPNDAKETFTIKSIKPGEVQPFEVKCNFYNFQYLGATSVPRVEIKVTDYEW